MRSGRGNGGRGDNQRALVFVAVTSLVAIAAACGGGGSGKPVTGPTASGRSSASGNAGSGGAFAQTPPPSGLPPLAAMPPPGVTGSKKATKKSDGALFACGGGARPIARDPAELVKRLGEACASAAKMKPVGAMIRAQQADRDAHQEHKVRVEANKCYRVVFATDENVHDAVVVMRDSAGDMVAESAGAALPEDGAVCFTTADEVTLMVGIGAGKGAYAAQVWSD
ncbi:MAG: hypothetical protein QOI41_3405 [Myxococcales bacterium]|jgi:hypothetical protein|nr:hypothetical protein [Myxococcales bacterium]